MHTSVHQLPRLGIAGAMRLYGLSARALRFYEERGLIQARRDRLNSRFYDASARVRIEWISRLRKAGVSIPDISAVLEAEDAEQQRRLAIAVLEKRRRALERELEAATSVLDEVSIGGDSLLRALPFALPASAPRAHVSRGPRGRP